MTRTVLLVDDDETLTSLLSFALDRDGFAVSVARDGAEAIRMAGHSRPDLVILDVMMPGVDGWETCTRLRQQADVPIMILSARGTEQDVVRGLSLGADDYLKKPFAVGELRARVDALLRRAVPPTEEQRHSLMTEGDLEINLARHEVYHHGDPVKLTPTEFRLLVFLMRNRGRVIPQEEILTNVWGPKYKGEKQYLKLFVHTLKKKIEADPAQPRYLHTVRGVGYRLGDSAAQTS
jgi:DNA-binding response OmpR family regulator